MKRKVFALAIVMFASISLVYGWGVWGHQHINKGAVLALPAEMGMFFYNHADFLTEESVMPDVRKHLINDSAESPRHFIDLDAFNYTTAAAMPQTMKDAIDKYGFDSIKKYGMMPWYMQVMMERLTEAFRSKSKAEILLVAADLGHYIGDAHMPLHTVLNHNGQLTGQVGIHSFWEAQLPEMFGEQYNLYAGEAHYIDNVSKATWDIIAATHKLADTMLLKEKKVRGEFAADKIFATDASGKPLKNKYGQPVFTKEYAIRYHQLLNGMVQQQLRYAIKATADFWYTAWVNAGKPDLSNLDPQTITDRNQKFYNEDMKTWKNGKIEGFKVNAEY